MPSGDHGTQSWDDIASRRFTPEERETIQTAKAELECVGLATLRKPASSLGDEIVKLAQVFICAPPSPHSRTSEGKVTRRVRLSDGAG